MADVRLAAARARARHRVDPADAATLQALDGPVWRLVERAAGPQRIVLLATTAEHPLGSDAGHAATLSETRLRTLLAVLTATRDPDAVHPWPGQTATVQAVLGLLGGARVPAGLARHYLAAFDELHQAGLLCIDDHIAGTVPDDAATVRVGPGVAAWGGPWLAELAELVARVARRDGRGGS